MAEQQILNNIQAVEAQILEACKACGRAREEILLLPVTKTVPAGRIITALQAGFSAVGENKVQEIEEKAAELAPFAPKVHLIGHLQTNKVKNVVGRVHCLQTLDSVKLAAKLHDRLEFEDETITALIQVHTAREDSKTGLAAEDVPALLQELCAMPRIDLQGFMTVSTNTDDEAEIRRCFRALKIVQAQAQQQTGRLLPELSMGMSGDLQLAVEEGSTILRIGSAIFGARKYPA